MAKDSANIVNYFLCVDESHKNDIAKLRQWTNLKVAFEEDKIWITNFERYQIESTEVKSIPYKSLYYSNNNKLFLKHSLLPSRKEPSLLWTPIERALPLKIDNYNHNFFGISEDLAIKLIPTQESKEAEMMLLSLKTLNTYAETAPEIRLAKLSWVIINDNEALVFGQPILPINGKVYWRQNDMLMPVGFDFELYLLNQQIEKIIDAEKQYLKIWNEDSSYFNINKDLLMPLSLGSIRKTIGNIKKNKVNPDNAK